MDSLKVLRDINAAARQSAQGAPASLPDTLSPRANDDAAIEAPPMIAGDERRMQVRAYNFWAQMLGDRNLPSARQLDLKNLGDFGDHAVLLDFTDGVENPGLAHLGKAIQEASGIHGDVKSLSEVPGRSLLSQLTDHYLKIISSQAPIGFEAEFKNEGGANLAYRGILLPFSDDGETINFILGVINWKEVASAALASALEREVAEALLAPQTVKATPSAPRWADGPDSMALGTLGPGDGDSFAPRSLETLRTIHPTGFAELDAGDNEFVLLVARKVSDSQVGVVGALDDHQLLDKVLRKLCQ